MAAARNDLARREGIQPGQIGVATVVDVQWPSTALGCPQPGMAYAQVITDGFRIVLTAGGKQYEYHSDRGSRVVLCQQR